MKDYERFISEVLAGAIELEKKLPQVYMRLPLVDFIHQNANLWHDIQVKIVERYPQYEAILRRKDLAFRVVFRPHDNNATLPGFSDTNMNTKTLSFWYGMDYRPEVGEYIGMTRGTPWAYYMLPDIRHADPREYHTLIYVYDNQGDSLVQEGQTTVGPIPQDNHLTQFLRMIVNISWVESDTPIDPLVHDVSIETLSELLRRSGISLD